MNKLFTFSTLSKQLIQDTERYYFLNHQKTKNELFFNQYQVHRENYFTQLLNCDIEKTPNWKMLIQNVFRVENEPHQILSQIIAKYSELYDIGELLQIKNPKMTQLLITQDNIYDLQNDVVMKCEGIVKILEDYEISPTIYREVELYKLFKHMIRCQKLNLKVVPLRTLNLIHHNIEKLKNGEFLHDIVQYQRSSRAYVNKLPNETWIMILEKLMDIHMDQIKLLLSCQLLQQFAHQKLYLKVNLNELLGHLIKQYKGLTNRENCLLEILRTVNIFQANRYELDENEELIKICRIEKQLQGEREYDQYMGLEKQQQSIELIDDNNLNNYLTEILLKDVTKITDQEKVSLREKIINKLQNEIDERSLKKIVVLSRMAWPNEISIVQKCARQIRAKLANNTQSKEMISLAINSLYEFKRVQYPFIDDQLLNYLASIDDLYINPQEISILLYYICLTQPKFTRKELTRIKERDYEVNPDVSKILINLIPVIQKMCGKNALRLKVIYTLTDCICKFKNDLKDIDLQYLFEKVEFNLVSELEMKHQCRVIVEQKDLDFLYDRFQFLKVGSRKLMRFFQDSNINYEKALRELLKRQKVYLRMRKQRGRAMRASRSF